MQNVLYSMTTMSTTHAAESFGVLQVMVISSVSADRRTLVFTTNLQFYHYGYAKFACNISKVVS